MTQNDDFFSAVALLNGLEHLDVDGMRLLYRVEQAGEQFYDRLAERIGDPRAAELLGRNGREERGHAERIRRAIGLKLGTAFEPPAADRAPYAIALPETVSPEMLAVIVQAERDGDAGYERWAERESDPEIQRLLRLNDHEETVHGERVVVGTMRGRLTEHAFSDADICPPPLVAPVHAIVDWPGRRGDPRDDP